MLLIETEATIDPTETSEPTKTPEPDPTLEPEAQKQLDLQSGITTALSAPEVLSEAELQSASVYESDNDVIYLGSDHPYGSNTLQIIKFTHSGATELTIYFAPKFELEKGYDTFGIYTFDAGISGYRLFEGKTYSGTDLAGQMVEIPGNTVVFRFQSDDGVELNGWRIVKIQAIYSEMTEPQPLSFGKTPDISSFLLPTETETPDVENEFFISDVESPEVQIVEETIFPTAILSQSISAEPTNLDRFICPSSGYGNIQDNSFFKLVLNNLEILVFEFSLRAFQIWKPWENTIACWNPLATTYDIAIYLPQSGCTATVFNGSSIKNYSSKKCDTLATSQTLKLSYYNAIRAFLARQIFDYDAIWNSMKTWIGSPAYSTSITNQWQQLWAQYEPVPPAGDCPETTATEAYVRRYL